MPVRDIGEMRSAHATVDLHFKREPGRTSGDQGDCLAPNHGSWVKVHASTQDHSVDH